MKSISVEIDHLVLDGVGVGLAGGPRVGRMLEQRLQRLLEQRGLPEGLSGMDVPEMAMPDIALPLGAGEPQSARAVALALYGILNRLR